MLSGISSCATLSFAPWTWKPLGAWSRFSSISFCGALRFAPWALTRVWASSRFSGISSCGGLAWPCGPSFPRILLLWGSASGPPPTSCQKWPVCPTSLQWIYQRRDRLHFAVFSLLGFHFLAFWPCGPSFPCILALWAFISLHFGLVGLHFLAFWPFRGQLPGPPPHVAKNYPFAQRPYNGFISAVTGPILQFLAFWAFISFHFGLVGVHFLVFWPCRPSFPCILGFCAFISLHFGLVGLHFLSFWVFRGQLLGPPPTSCQKWPVCPTSLQWIYQRRDRLHFVVFSLLGFHFLAFWPCGPSFPCILALRASFPCILAFSGSASGPPPHVAKNGTFAQRPYNGFISAVTGSYFAVSSLLGLHFLAFWPCGPSFPFISGQALALRKRPLPEM